MSIEFKKQDKIAKFLNPFQNFETSEVKCQIRWDPLTGRTGRLAHFVGFKPQAADFSTMIEESEKNCPFCPGRVLELTPKFSPEEIPEGRLVKGESVLFPNLLPYDEHSALIVLCKEHYKDLTEFSGEVFRNAFENCLDYFDRVIEDKKEKFALLTWNYMPAAGSSQVHPHFQVYASTNPGNFLQNMLKKSKKYYQDKGKPYWEDFLEAEKESGERLVKEGEKSIWLTDFVSLSPLTDLVGFFPGRQTIFDLSEEELEEAAEVLDNILKYLGKSGVYSLNFAWQPAVEGRKDHWLQLRISPRLYLAPQVWCTDTMSLVYQYQESFMVWSPEETAREIRDFLNT